MNHLISKISLKISWLAILSCLLPAAANATLNGTAAITYTNLKSENARNDKLNTQSFTQNYSLLYQKKGKIVDGRLGSYSIALGYDWAMFDTSIQTSTDSTHSRSDNGRFTYSGSFRLDPKEMPFKLTAYSNDMTRSTPITSPKQGLNGNNFYIPTGFTSGVHNRSGATLIMGVKNGMTNGYNEFLRHFPMVMLDYQDTINYSLTNQEDNRLSKLAFVSLNKKDNWFHYRLINYNDYLNPANNYNESQIQLGTVDQTLTRRWIDFTNWLTVSVDGQISRTKNAESSYSLTAIDLNLFAAARRNKWDARMYNNFSRHSVDSGYIMYQTTIPVYTNINLNADTSLSTQTSYNESHSNGNSDKTTNLFGSYRVNTFNSKPFTLSHSLNIGSSTAASRDVLNIAASVESTSTARFSRTFKVGGTYNISRYKSESHETTDTSLVQNLSLNAYYTPSNTVRYVFQQTNRMSTKSSNSNNITTPVIFVNPLANGSEYYSASKFSINWTPKPRFDVSFDLNQTFENRADSSSFQSTVFTNKISYKYDYFTLTSNNSFNRSNYGGENSTYSMNSANSLTYTFNRNLNTSINLNYTKNLDNASESDSYTIEQALQYSYYKRGMGRKLLDISQNLIYARSTATFGSTSSTNRMSVGIRYYPISRLVLGAGSQYSYINTLQNYQFSYYGSIGMNFRLFQANIDYSYGKTKNDNLIEKKLSASIKKSF